MNRLERALRDHRNALNAIDRAVLGNLLNEYEQVMTRLNPKIELLVQEIQGQDYASLTQLLRVTRMQELQRQIMAEMDGLATKTEGITRIGQARAVNHAVDGAQTITSASVAGNPATVMTSYNRINPGAVQEFIGATQSGPLQELLSSFGETVERAMLTALTDGIALGTNPRGIADIIRRSTDIGRNRALTIARTEVLRAYRSATLQNYQANTDILKGWIWLSAKQTRTCAACLAMDGTFHELDEPMASHPNCRCVCRPSLKNAPMRNVKTGKQWLDGQAPDAQDAVLGKAGGAAYRAGEVELQDFVKVTESQDWGKTTTDGGVAFARLNAARRANRPVVLKKPVTEWSTVKSEADAREWASATGGTLSDRTFYHFTAEENVASIRKDGLRVGGGSLGEFVYATAKGEYVSSIGAKGQAKRLQLVTNIKKPLVVKSELFFDKKKGLGKYKINGRDLLYSNKFTRDVVRDLLAADGYDGVIVDWSTDPYGKSKGEWLLAFDARDVVIIEEE